MVSKLDYAKISADVYNDTSGGNLGGWKRVDLDNSLTRGDNGFRGAVYVNEATKQVVVSYAGTERGEVTHNEEINENGEVSWSWSHSDLQNDGQLAWDKIPAQADNTCNFYGKLITAPQDCRMNLLRMLFF